MYHEYSLAKRLLALFLSAVLVLGMIPVNQVSAAETEEAAKFAFAIAEPEAIQYQEGLTYENTASGGEGNGAITYTITSGSEIAAIDENTGMLTISNWGSVTVQAVKAAEGDVLEQTAAYTLQILQPEKKNFSFDVAEPEDLEYKEELTYLNAASGGEGEGAVTYALLVMPEKGEEDPEHPGETLPLVPEETEKTDVAEIDTNTGELTILKPGTVTVRAKKAADGEISEQVDKYELQIVRGEQTNFEFAQEEAFFAYSATEQFVNEAEGGESTGDITYAITEGEDVAEVDAETGAVTAKKLGSVTVTATKAGDEKYKEATASYTLQITYGTQSGFGFDVAAPDSLVYENDATFENPASGGESTGAVTYRVKSGAEVATVDENTGVLSILDYGTVVVEATKAGDDKYLSATAEYSLTVTKKPQTDFGFETEEPEAMDYKENLTYTNTASGGEGTGEISYSVVENKDVATVDAQTGELTIKKHGTVTVKATKAEDDVYAQAEAVYTLTINGLEQEPLVFAIPSPEMWAFTQAGMGFGNKASGGSGTGAISYAVTEGADIAKVNSEGWLTINGKGTITVTATKAADNVYEPVSASYTVVSGEAWTGFYFEEKNPVITYAPDLTFSQTPKDENEDESAKVSYSIRPADYAVAAIDQQTGELRILKSGEVQVTATKSATSSYAAASTQYLLTVKAAEQTGFQFKNDQVTVTYGDNGNVFSLETIGGESTGAVAYTVLTDAAFAELTEDNNLLIKKAGEIIVQAVKAGDDCYLDSAPATLTLTVNKASQTIAFAETAVQEIYGILEYTQEATEFEPCSTADVIYTIEGENGIGASIDAASGKLTFGDSAGQVGTITVKATKPGDDCYDACSAEYTFTLDYAEKPEEAYKLSGEKKNESGWYTDDVTISAPEGYKISCDNLLSTNNWEESVVCRTEGENEAFTVYLKNIETGRMTAGIVVEGLKIDKTKPVSLNIEYKTAAWATILEKVFGISQKTVEVFFSANDLVSGVDIMEFSIDGGESFAVVEKTLDSYSTSISAQYRNQVVLRVTDVAGNVITTQEDEDLTNNDKTLVVDDIAPEIATVFNGEHVYNEEDGIYYAGGDAFAITFTVSDANFDLREANPVVKVNDVVQELSWSTDATSGNAVLDLPNEGHYIITADFTDRSENAAQQFKAVVYVDKTAPARTVTFNDPSRIVTAAMQDVSTFAENDEVVLYYNADAVATIVIREENFRAEDVTVTVNGTPAALGEWEKTSSGSWKNTVTLSEEGDYTIVATYKDRSMNEMEVYTSQRIVIDKTMPVIAAEYGNADVKGTVDGHNGFTKPQSVTITIHDRNFRADDVRVLVSARDVAGTDVLDLNADGVVKSYAADGADRKAWTPYVEGTWRNENDTYELTLEFDADANYTFDIEYTDLANNQAADYKEDAFTVDKTAPEKLTISYSESVLEETRDGVAYAYYQEPVTVTVTAEDQTTGVHSFNYSYLLAENVSSVNAGLENQTISAKRKGAEGTATFEIPKEKLEEINQFNGTVSMVAGDVLENQEGLVDTKRIVVDNIKPTAQVTYNEPVQTVDGVAYYAGDIHGTIVITEANFFSEDVVVTVTKDGEDYATEVTWTDDSVDEHTGEFALTEDGHYQVKVAYTDKSGNKMETYTSQKLVRDIDAPTDLSISYEEYGEGDAKYPNKFAELIDQLRNLFYYNTAAKVTIQATDVTSGMEKIALNVTTNGSEGATTIDLPENLVIGANGKITGEQGAIKAIEVKCEDGVMTVTCRIPEEFRGALDFVAVDMSHNEASYSDDVVVVVDTIAPQRTVTLTPNHIVDEEMKDVAIEKVKEGDNVVYYYNMDAVATFDITEANFHQDDVVIAVQKDGAAYAVEPVWAHVGNDDWRGTVTLSEEGDYTLSVSYQDRSRNEMVSYASPKIIIDKTAPVIATNYSNTDVKNDIDNRKYFAQAQSVTITIEERNFRADDVKILVSAKDVVGTDVLTLNADGVVESYAAKGADRAAWTPYVAGTWRSEDDTYELTLEFDEDANYTFDIEYTDLANNQAGDYLADTFTVDMTAPGNLTISYNESVLEETRDGVAYAYYQEPVTVTVTAADETTGVHSFNYSYLLAENVSSVNAGLENQTISAVRDGAKGTATFVIPKEKLEEINQFNGSVSIIAADRSENQTGLADTKRIIVDNIAPVTEVTYSEKGKAKHDENCTGADSKADYYNGDIVATISITEANFFSEDVVVTVMKDGKADDTEVTWTDKNVDEHIGEFTLKQDGHYFISVAYTDKSGNVQVNKDGELMEVYTSQELVLDTKAPVDLNISYEDEDSKDPDDGKFPKKFEEIIAEITYRVFYYNKDKTVVTLTASDRDMEGIALKVTKDGSDGATTAKLPENLVIGANGKITGEPNAIEDIAVKYEGGVMTVTCAIPKQFRGHLEIKAADMSHNNASYSDDVIVVVDTIAPTRTVTFTPNRVVDGANMTDVDIKKVNEGDDVVYYYKDDAVVTFDITEANFYQDDVVIAVQKDGGAYAVEPVWTHIRNDDWRGTVTLTEEGDYTVSASYIDRARNEMKVYTSQRIVIDKTVPVITTVYKNATVKNTIDGRDYLNTKPTLTITIKEKNFRADDVKISVSAKNADGGDVAYKEGGISLSDFYKNTGVDRAEWTPYIKGTWRNEKDEYVLILSFDQDANYTFDVEYEDLATNQAENYEEDQFTVDTTVPTDLKISYSNSVLETVLNSISFGFYNERVKVKIEAKDATSGIYYFVYSYLKAPNVSSVNKELANQKIEISGPNSGASAEFWIPKEALGENNQFNGNVEFTAYDRSENSASLKDEKRIVVDNISPTSTVTFKTPTNEIEEVTYYNKDIECIIDMEEANFYSEDVKVTVTKDEKPVDVKVTWTQNSSNRNTGTFTLKEDGIYIVSIQYTDKSGNKMVDYVSKKHVLDKKLPVVKVSNIKANSANKDEKFGFVIDIQDINLDVESMKPLLTAVVKDENGLYTIKEIPLGDPVAVENGTHYTFTVENLLEDALYTLTCNVLDKAKNTTIAMQLDDEQAYEVVEFSINRNGSTFGYGDDFTQKLVEQYYVYSVNEDVVIVEVNVDPIENYVIKVNGEELTEGRDFTTTQTSKEGEWSRRIYYIDKDLFESEGEYNIVVSTVDKAETMAFSDVKNLVVAFVVDQTKPVVTITGLENGGRYQTNEQTVTLIPTDEGGRLNSLRVVVFDSDGNPMKSTVGADISVRFEMSGEEFRKYLEKNDGKVTFTIPEGLNNQVQIICNDCAVNADNQTNEYNELFTRVTVSQNKMIIFYANKPLFYGTIGGICGTVLLAIFILLKRKKKNEEQ